MTDRIFEMHWICPGCGGECRGRDERCNGPNGQAGCGAARPASVRFFLPGAAPEVTDPELVADALSGPDWTCDHCGGANNGGASSCASCGNARDARDAATPTRLHAPGEMPSTGAAAAPVRPSRRMAEASPAPDAGDGRMFAWILGICALLILVAGWLILGYSSETRVTVTALPWTRTIAIEELKTLHEDGWSVPAGARVTDRDRRIRSWRNVLDHYETRTRSVTRQVADGTESYACGMQDMGNGYARERTCSRTRYRSVQDTETYQEPVYRNEPVWDTFYEWDIDRWVKVRSPEAHGDGEPRQWPEAVATGDRERVGPRQETLSAALRDENGVVWVEGLREASWRRLERGTQITVERDIFGSLQSIRAADGHPIVLN
ncbi:hypothetical protein LAZ40_04805 [Cereibacter sphaeroides]|uniref:hypothetical protein n=1 Tax=Cereibacter sphaeroides TaxID=1063 RepID=UPI001F2606CF|nr:hypothetical protein [Cereibacter sphaeroides]MCE6958376.1 hypothetical protein [Cereibacter sphaeroides]MCE6972243.1 hypothetical protein [Cereibacter sphaeroides]